MVAWTRAILRQGTSAVALQQQFACPGMMNMPRPRLVSTTPRRPVADSPQNRERIDSVFAATLRTEGKRIASSGLRRGSSRPHDREAGGKSADCRSTHGPSGFLLPLAGDTPALFWPAAGRSARGQLSPGRCRSSPRVMVGVDDGEHRVVHVSVRYCCRKDRKSKSESFRPAYFAVMRGGFPRRNNGPA